MIMGKFWKETLTKQDYKTKIRTLVEKIQTETKWSRAFLARPFGVLQKKKKKQKEQDQ